MNFEVIEEPMTALADHLQVPIAFEVRSVLEVPSLTERSVTPYIKDYDEDWSSFDLSKWGLISAWSENVRVGGVVIAFDTAGVTMLEGRRDLAVLWDIRVAPESRGKRVGSALFRAAESWAAARGCRQLKVETQNINVAACRFYEQKGCILGAVHRFVYPDLPEEVQLLWYKSLDSSAEDRDNK